MKISKAQVNPSTANVKRAQKLGPQIAEAFCRDFLIKNKESLGPKITAENFPDLIHSMAKTQAFTAFNEGVHGMDALEVICADIARTRTVEWMKENADAVRRVFSRTPEIS